MSLTDIVVKENNINTDIEKEIAQRLGQDHISTDSTSSSSEESGSEDVTEGCGKQRSGRGGEGMRRCGSLGSPRDEQLRSVERTALRLLRRSKSNDGVLLRKRRILKRERHLSESDSDSCGEEMSIYLSNMDIGNDRVSHIGEKAAVVSSHSTARTSLIGNAQKVMPPKITLVPDDT